MKSSVNTHLLKTQSSIDAVPVPDSDFAAEELLYFARLHNDTGSRAARALAKNLLRDWLRQHTGTAPPAHALAILTDGEPPRLLCDTLPENLVIAISLSHSPTHAACALHIYRCL